MFNKIILVGRLTADVEIKKTSKDTSVTSFSLACDRAVKNKDGEKVTDFISIVAWGKSAEFISTYFHKGDICGIEGNLQIRSYEDKSGAKRTVAEVVVEKAFFVGGKSSSVNRVPSEKTSDDMQKKELNRNSGYEVVEDDEELPW